MAQEAPRPRVSSGSWDDRLHLPAIGRAVQADVTAAEPRAPVEGEQTLWAAVLQVGVRACEQAGLGRGVQLRPGQRGERRAGEPRECARRRAGGRGGRAVCF